MSFCSTLHQPTSLRIKGTSSLPPNLSRPCISAPSLVSSSLQHARFSFNPLLGNSPGSRRGVSVVSRAVEEPFDAKKVATDALKDLQEAWDKTEDKLALGSLGFSAFLSLWASAGVISAIDSLPLLPSFFELVGVFFSTWFAYRYLLFKPDREELRKKVDDILSRILGSKDEYGA